jgi:hypothetical protein
MISIVINCDSRPERNSQQGLFKGVVDRDFLDEGIRNKKLFFSEFDIETIVFIDKHEEIPEPTLKYLYSICDTVCIRRHTGETSFNDYNYLNALSLARGEIICHCDQDTALFTSGKEYVEELISHLERHRFVSYPSKWTPKPVDDPSFGHRVWASTRFFLCKRETIKIDTLRNCIEEPEWAYKTFGDSPRRCNWMEHYLTLSNNDSCYYPPIELNKGAIFTWGSYEKWIWRRLNESPYEDVKKFIHQHGGIQYPNDVFV